MIPISSESNQIPRAASYETIRQLKMDLATFSDFGVFAKNSTRRKMPLKICPKTRRIQSCKISQMEDSMSKVQSYGLTVVGTICCTLYNLQTGSKPSLILAKKCSYVSDDSLQKSAKSDLLIAVSFIMTFLSIFVYLA